MYMMILRLIWPFIARQGASYAANFLENRRQQRLERLKERPPECPPCPPCPPAAESSAIPAKKSWANPIWFGLSGVLLSSAVALVAYLLVRDSR